MLVDIVHLHRGYVSDCTRIFSAGKISELWHSRLDDMIEVRKVVVSSLGRGIIAQRHGKLESLLLMKWVILKI